MRDKVAVIGNITVDHVVGGREEGYSPGGAINPAYILKELLSPEQVLLVSNIGDDDYARIYIEPELKKMRDNYVRRIEDAPTRFYEVDISNPKIPKFTRKEETQILMNHSHIDITPVLPEISTIHFQSSSQIYEGGYRNRMVELIRKAYDDEGVHVILDWNKRKVFKSKKTEEEQKEVLDMLDTLKMNECELKLFVEPNTNKKSDKIRLRKGKLEKFADEIMGSYDIKRLVITRRDRGSYVQTRHKGLKLWFDALKPQILIDCLGTGDASAVAYDVKDINELTEREAGVLSNILGSLATEDMFSYPHSITRTRIRQSLITRRGYNYCNRYDVDCRRLARKLGLL